MHSLGGTARCQGERRPLPFLQEERNEIRVVRVIPVDYGMHFGLYSKEDGMPQRFRYKGVTFFDSYLKMWVILQI